MWTLLIGLSFVLVLGASRCHSSAPSSVPATPSPADPTNAIDPAPTWTSQEWAALQALSPASLPAPPPDPTNRFAGDPAAAALGQRLFYDPSFSGPLLDSDNDGGSQSLGNVGQTGRVACAGCHVPSTGFSDTRSFQRQISLGAGWGRRRAPSLLDVGQAKLLMWDGRRDALYNQIFGPLESVVEMNSSRLYVAQQIRRRYAREYEAIFGVLPQLDDPRQFPELSAAATGCRPKNARDPQPVCDGTFHGMPGDHAEFDGLSPDKQRAVTAVVVNMGKAIAAFEGRITCGSASFDAWMHGQMVVSRAAQRGAALFVGRAGCVRCHSGPFLSDQKFHNVGLKPQVVQQAFTDANDRGAAAGLAAALADPLNSAGPYSDGSDGRLPPSVGPDMDGAFRTPTLRCLSARPTFLHTGQIRTVAGVVSFFNQGGNTAGYPGTKEIGALGLSALEQSDLVAFLESLNGPGADPKYRHSP